MHLKINHWISTIELAADLTGAVVATGSMRTADRSQFTVRPAVARRAGARVATLTRVAARRPVLTRRVSRAVVEV